jgi:hypothetical protein
VFLKNSFRKSFVDTGSLIIGLFCIFLTNVFLLHGCLLRPSGPSKALKLGAKGKEVDNFVDKLKSEGETIVSSNMGKRTSEATKVHTPPVNMER